jgi:drug/metabolite transporter (DMT)-like permease
MNKENKSLFLLGATAACFSVACWGTVPVFMKYLTGHMDAWTMNMYRYSMAAAVYIPFLVYYRIKGDLTGRLFLLTLFPTAVNTIGQILWAESIYHLKAGMVGIFIKTSIIWAALFSFIVFKDERPLLRKPVFWIGLMVSFCSFVGISLTSLDFSQKAALTGLGVILPCSLFWGLYPVSVKMALKDTKPVLSFGLICINSSILLTVLGLIKGTSVDITEFSGKTLIILAVSAFVGIALSHITYYYALNTVGVVTATNFTMVTPFFTLILSNRIFNEELSPGKIIFGIGIIAGVFAVTLTRSRIQPSEQRRLT